MSAPDLDAIRSDFAKYGCGGTLEYGRCHDMSEDYAALLAEVKRLTAERDEARAALAALVAWVADEIGYPAQMVMGPPIPAAAWPVLVDHVHADASGNWHGNTLDREDTEAWLADEAGIDLTTVLANHPTTKKARCGSREAHAAHSMPCDSGCQPDWHRDDCAIYGDCPGLDTNHPTTKEADR